MPHLAAWAIQTPAGDAQHTLHALRNSSAQPGRLGGDLLATLVQLGHQVLGGQPPDLVLLASTKGDLPRYSDAIVANPSAIDGSPAELAAALAQKFACPVWAISGACASGPIAIAEAARMLSHGEFQRILVLGGERLGPFVDDGFASLGAIATDACRPFDAARSGIRLGETAAAVLITNQGPVQLRGWGQSMDASHRTAPARDGAGLVAAAQTALSQAGLNAPAIIMAHGTGTRANDAAEAIAYVTHFPSVPITAWKGGLGHSLGACGLSEIALVAELIATNSATPGIVGLADDSAPPNYLRPGSHHITGPWLSTNAGFGGINAAVVLDTPQDHSAPARPSRPASCRARVDINPDGWHDHHGKHGTWAATAPGRLARPSAREVLGVIDPLWGKMDSACRLLVGLGYLLGPWPDSAGIVLLSHSGSLETDRHFEQQRRAGTVEPQVFAYTLPSAPLGEASIRLQVKGPGMALLGISDADARACVRRLLHDNCPAILLARIDTAGTKEIAWAERWEPA